MTEISVEVLNICGAPLEGENPLPVFRDRKHDIPINTIEPFPAEKKHDFGREAGFRVLPYRMQDRYSRKRIPMQFKKIVLKNDYLEASFLPEAGGRLISLVDRVAGRELLYRNPIFQPANLAIRNAWFSGGIEWNIGQIGHTFYTCAPVFAAVVAAGERNRFLRLYEFERCKRLFWQIDFHLPPESKVLYAHTRLVNPGNTEAPIYWWTNIAVPETQEARVFASAGEVIYKDVKGAVSPDRGYGYTKMPELPSLPGKDASYPLAFDSASEYFFQCPPVRMPWEAAVYKEGKTFFEVSTSMLRYRKMFCWGNHAGGRHWQEFLAGPGGAYFEIQAGLASTQMHGLGMPGKAIWEWTQAFGGTTVDCKKAQDRDWFAARSNVEEKIKSIIAEPLLYEKDALFREAIDIPPETILHTGSGWGALEIERMLCQGEGTLPAGFSFPRSTLGEEQYPWLSLLKEGFLPERIPEQHPGAWMIQKEWKQTLFSSLEEEKNRNWYALLHAGVIAFEEGCAAEAEKLWRESVKKCPSVWAYRNLAAAAKVKGDISLAVAYMQKAWEKPAACCNKAMAEEYLTLLKEASRYREVWDIFEKLPPDIQASERVELIAGSVALELGKYEYVQRLFGNDFSSIREGELAPTDLWFRYHTLKRADEMGMEVDGALTEYVKANCPPPPGLDFRLADE